MDPVTLTAADLATVAGAGLAAGVLAEFAKRLFGLARGWVRTVALLAGLGVVLAAYFTTAEAVTVLEVLLATVVGAQAGLSASAMFDAVDSGPGYEVHEAGAYSNEDAW